MNLSQFKVIPQSNVRKNEISLEDLKPLFVPEVVKPDLTYDEETKRFRVKLSFVKNLELTEGFTAITDGISTYLIKTSETDVNIDLRPKFLKSNVTQYFKSDYLRLLTKHLGNELFLHETKIEDYQAFLVSKDKESPFGKTEEILIQTDLPMYFEELAGITSNREIESVEGNVVTFKEEPETVEFTYTSDLLDQPVEENVEEPSLF